MLTRRIIPCLDIRDGRVVKGVGFANLRDIGDPVDLARRYAGDGADELCFLDVTASVQARPLLYELIRRVSKELFIPFTVGGGVRSAEDARQLLRCGADKIALNTAAVKEPALLTTLADEFGRQCVVLSIDTLRTDDGYRVTTHGGRTVLERECVAWATEGAERGAGEILLNAINSDGALNGYDLDITGRVAARVDVPVIASGGAGKPEHFVRLFRETSASAALAASIFHDGAAEARHLKTELRAQGVEVRD